MMIDKIKLKRLQLLIFPLIITVFLLSGCGNNQPQPDYFEVAFKSDDGMEVKGLLYLPQGAEADSREYPAVVLAHMYQNNKRSWDSFARKLAERGYVALPFDFRAWGESGGDRADILNHYRDVIAAVDFLKNLKVVNPARIAVIGASMGGMAAIEAAVMDSAISAVVAICAPHSWMGSEPMNVVDKISPRPLLVIAAANDPHVTLRSAEQNFIRAKEPKEWAVIDAARHGTDILATDKAAELENLILSFLDKYMKSDK